MTKKTAQKPAKAARRAPAQSKAPTSATRARARIDERAEAPAAVWLDPARLKPWPGNPRDTDAAVDRVAASIERFGFGAPIVARAADFEIIAGHTRYRAALKRGDKRVPVRLLELDADAAHMLALRDNRDTELTQYRNDQLAALLAQLTADERTFVGWSEYEYERLTKQLAEATPPQEFDSYAEGDTKTVTCPRCGFSIAAEAE